MTTPTESSSPDLVILSPQGMAPEGEAAPDASPWVCLRLPAADSHTSVGDGAPPWRDRAAALLAHTPAWQQAPYVLVLDDAVQISAAAVTELFRVMRQYDLRLAQPSLAWQSHFADPTTLHNPCFVYRHTNRVDPAALAFSAAMLRQLLPLLQALPQRPLLARLLPAGQDDVLHGAAVVDAVRAQRLAPVGDDELAEPEWPASLQADGPQHEASYSWGGVGMRGQSVNLFDDSRETFLGLLAAGFACAVQEPPAIGEVFLQHFARSLEPPPQPLRLATPAPAAPAATTLRRSPIFDHRLSTHD